MSLGEQLKKARELRELKLSVIAERLKVTETTISRYESNERKPDPETLAKLADVLGCSVDWLLERTSVFKLMAAPYGAHDEGPIGRKLELDYIFEDPAFRADYQKWIERQLKK